MGAEFSLNMTQARIRYRSVSRVIAHEPPNLLTWESFGRWRGHRIVGGQRWEYRLDEIGEATEVCLTYRWGYSRFALLTLWLPGYVRRVRRTLPDSLANLAAAAETPG